MIVQVGRCIYCRVVKMIQNHGNMLLVVSDERLEKEYEM